MCLAIPMKVVELEGMEAVAEVDGVKTRINITLYPDLMLGDKVLVHAGFAIEKLDEQAAKEIEETWAEYHASIKEEFTN